MNDHDLRALAAKLLKHYVVEDEAVAKIVETKALERGEPKVVPLITAEERALLNMLGGPMAGAMECRVVSLAAQGCGCGCGCGCGDGDEGEDGSAAAAAAAAAAATSTNADTASTEAQNAASMYDNWGAMMSALGVNAQDAPADPSTTAAPDSISISATQSASPDISNMTDAQLEAALNADVAAATAAANAAATSSAPGATTGAGTAGGVAGGTAGGVAGGVEGGTGSGAGGSIGGIGDVLGGLFGIGSAQAATDSPKTSGVSDVIAAATAAANKGQLSQFLAANNTAAQVLAGYSAELAGLQATNNAVLGAQGQQGIYGSQPGYTTTGSKAGGASLGQGTSSALTADEIFAMNNALVDNIAITTPSVATPAAAPALAPSSGFNYSGPVGGLASTAALSAIASQNALANSLAAGTKGGTQIGSTPSATPTAEPSAPATAPAAPTAPEQVATAPAATVAPAAPNAPSLGPAIDVASLNTYNVGPVVAAPSAPTVSSPTAMSSTSTQAQTPSYTGIPAIDSRIDNAINNPGQTAINLGVGFVPGLGIANTVSGLLGGPTIGGLVSGAYNSGAISGAEPGSSADTSGGSGGGGDSGGGVIPPLSAPTGSQGIDLNTFDPTSLPTATSPVDTTNAALRRYLGITGDPTKYGFGAQQQLYAAKGGYFDANQYFADGGLVQPLSAPTIPLVSAQPTMAFTDGAGAVGNIAQPPGLAPSDSYGFDATTASPMAPSVAAAVPTMQPGLATLASPNVNASPVPSPIAQNPNVGYALGNSPLSNLTRS